MSASGPSGPLVLWYPGSVFYMIVSIPDLCLLSYFNCRFSYTTTNFLLLLDHVSFIRSADNALLTQKIASERICHVFSRL